MPIFLHKVCFSDEVQFTKNGINNCHNYHVWALENPHAKRETAFQDNFSVNIWAGIIGNNLVSPFYLPDQLNGAN